MNEPDPIGDAVSEVVRQIIKGVTHPFRWLSSSANRARLRGARVEVMAFIVCRNPEPSILLGQSPYSGLWMPPQEGVCIGETFQQALRRCLEVECGIHPGSNEGDFPKEFHLRSIRYIGEVALATERVGERLVADDAIGTWLESVQLRRKAYWMATMLLANLSDIGFQPDGKELIDLRWFSLSEARRVVAETNHPKKTLLLIKSLDACEKDFRGAPH